MTTTAHYKKLEAEFATLLAALPMLSDENTAEVLHFLHVGEYGLALETLVGIVHEEKMSLPPEAMNHICRLSDVMELGDSPINSYIDKVARTKVSRDHEQ